MKRSQNIGMVVVLAMSLLAGGMAVAAPAKRVATLSSSNDSNAKGRAVLRVEPSEKKICFRITWENIKMNPTFGSIDRFGGYSEVELFNNDNGPHSSPITGCARGVERHLAKEIKEHPRRFEVSIFQYATSNALEGRLRRPR